MPGLAPYKAKIAAGKRVTINARGTTIFLRKATGELKVEVRSLAVGDSDGAQYTLRMEQAEEWLHADTFDAVVLENTLAVENVVELYLGFGRFIKPVPDIVNVQLTSSASGTAETIADKVNIDVGNAGKEELLPADSTRIQAYITALATNVEVIRVGDDSVDTGQGTPVAAGDSILWTSKAACFACSIATVNQAAALTVFKE